MNLEDTPPIKSMPKLLQQHRAQTVHEIQQEYFTFLEKHFAAPYQIMQKNGRDPDEVAAYFAGNNDLVKASSAQFEWLFDWIKTFWETNAQIVYSELRSRNTLKSIFSGDIFASHSTNLPNSAGLYFDTIVLPDPLLRIGAYTLGNWEDKDLLFQLIKYVLTLLRDYKNLALAPVDPPIVIIVPDSSIIDQASHQKIGSLAESDLLWHFEKMFGKVFVNKNELDDFLNTIQDINMLENMLKDPPKFLVNIECDRSIKEQLNNYQSETSRFMLKEFPLSETIYKIIAGRFLATNRDLLASNNFHGTPIIQAPTSWQYLLWKHEYDAERSDLGKTKSLDAIVFAKVIQKNPENNLALLSNVPNEALIELRKRGALSELRETMRSGINSIESASADELKGLFEQVSNNLNNAMTQHKKQLSDLESSRNKFFGYEITRWLGIGAMQIVGAFTGNNTLTTLSAALSVVVGAPSACDVLKKGSDIKNQTNRLKRSAAGILFRHLKKQ